MNQTISDIEELKRADDQKIIDKLKSLGNLKIIEKLQLLEWLDDFIEMRIERQNNLPAKDEEIVEIYMRAREWNAKQRLVLAREIIKF